MSFSTQSGGTLNELAVRRRWRIALLGLLAFLLTLAPLLAQPAGPAHADPAITVDRITGADRYEVAVNISKDSFSGAASSVFLATGANYPDALSAVPAARGANGPLLLTPTDALPDAVAAEIVRLAAPVVYIVGGPNSVSPAVEEAVKALSTHPYVTRISGADRYAVSRNLLSYGFYSSASSTAFLATGANFPDALSAGPAAAVIRVPVLLTPGSSATLDQPTKDVLVAEGKTTVKIAGGPNSVSPGIEADLKTFASTVLRLGGADRYDASRTINDDAFSSSSRVFLATGLKFPDALAGGVYAGSRGAPLFVVPSDCIPQATLDSIADLGATQVTLLGGEASLGPAVQSLTPCGPPAG